MGPIQSNKNHSPGTNGKKLSYSFWVTFPLNMFSGINLIMALAQPDYVNQSQDPTLKGVVSHSREIKWHFWSWENLHIAACLLQWWSMWKIPFWPERILHCNTKNGHWGQLEPRLSGIHDSAPSWWQHELKSFLTLVGSKICEDISLSVFPWNVC